MEESKTQKVIGKINAIRKIADSTHSKAEKETCMQLAAKLIAEHQLSEAELAVTQGNNGEPIDLETESIIYESGRVNQWKSELAQRIAGLNGLFIMNAQVRNDKTHRLGNRYRVIGRRSDVEIALYMMTYLTTMITDLSYDYVPGGKDRKRGVNPERESWSLGCVRGYIAKMQAEKDAVNKAATTTALVFIGNKVEEAKTAYMQKAGIKKMGTSNYRPQGRTHEEALASGYKKGQTLNVNQGLGGSTEAQANQLYANPVFANPSDFGGTPKTRAKFVSGDEPFLCNGIEYTHCADFNSNDDADRFLMANVGIKKTTRLFVGNTVSIYYA